MNAMKQIKKLLIFILICIFASLYTFISLTKHQHYQTGLDFAIYIQMFWDYMHFRAPFVTLYPTFGDLVWADHFSPSFVLETPLYWLWSNQIMFFIVQSFFYCFGAYAVFLFTKEKLQHVFFALALAFTYLIFFGTQFPVTFDFHTATYAASFLPWVLLTMFRKQWKTYVLLSLIMLGAKEDAALYIAGLSLYLIITRINWKLGIVMIITSLSFFIFVTKYFMPGLVHFSTTSLSLSYFSFTPQYFFSVFFSSPIKIQTVLLSFINFLFIPIFSGWFLLLPLIHFLINFSNPNFPGRWGIYLHYRSYLTSIMCFATVLGYMRLMKLKPNWFNVNKTKTIVACLLIIDALLLDFTLHQPLNSLLKKQFYYKESWIADNDRAVAHVPKDAYLLTTNHFAPHVAARKNIYYFPQNLKKAEYILVDLHPNQPIVNFWESTKTQKELEDSIYGLLKSKEFVIAYRSGDAMVLKRP